MKRVRVLLADDHALVRAGFCALIRQIEGVEIIAEAADGPEALRLISEFRPDIAFIDLSMPGLNGLEVTTRAAKEYPETRIIILSMHADDEYVIQAIRAGASGYVLKDADIGELDQGIRTVVSGRTFLCSAVDDRITARFPGGAEAVRRSREDDHSFAVLTPRQREVLQLIAEGLTTREIAARLNLSIKTIETHRTQIMDRLNIRDLAGLVRYAIRSGIASPE